MDKTRSVTIAKKVEALAIGFIGVCFFSMGTTYFQERFIYRMPRILMPVYDLLGPIGLAIAMLLLGLGLIVWGFTMWKSAGGKKSIYLILAVVTLAVGVFLANNANLFEDSKSKSSEEIMQQMEDNRQKQMEEVRQTKRPDLKNEKVDKYFDDFDALYTQLEKAITTEEADALNEEYMQLMTQTTDLIQQLDKKDVYEFSKYNAKQSMQWYDKMQEFWNE
jgi:hypothetical protein